MRTLMKLRFALVAVAASAALGGCADAPAPTAVAERVSQAPLSYNDGNDGAGQSKVRVSKASRGKPLSADLTVTTVIGPEGGTIEIPEAGFRLVVPPFAVSSDVSFTVTALAGTAMAYQFEPHGLSFAVPLTMMQWYDQPGTAFSLGYFGSRADVENEQENVEVSETRRAQYSPLSRTIVTTIPHFSGWVVSTGRGGRAPAESLP